MLTCNTRAACKQEILVCKKIVKQCGVNSTEVELQHFLSSLQVENSLPICY